MATEPNDAIDKVLAALRDATPPAGMEARISQRLAEAAAAPAAQSLLQRLRHKIPSSAAWWSGALTGAAIATLAICSALLMQHRFATPASTPHTAATQPAVPAPTAVSVTTSRALQANPCPNRAVLQARPNTTDSNQRLLAESRIESIAPSRPAHAIPLNAQERELVRLARLGNPREVTAASPDTLAKLQDQEAADFDKFFTPPPPPSANNE